MVKERKIHLIERRGKTWQEERNVKLRVGEKRKEERRRKKQNNEKQTDESEGILSQRKPLRKIRYDAEAIPC